MAEEYRFKRQMVPANYVIFDEGQAGDAAYMIVQGEVDIRIGMNEENPQSLGTRGKGHVIGEIALFKNSPRTAAAVTLSPTELLVISKDEFIDRIDALDPIMRGIIENLIDRVMDLSDNVIVRRGNVEWREWKIEKEY